MRLLNDKFSHKTCTTFERFTIVSTPGSIDFLVLVLGRFLLFKNKWHMNCYGLPETYLYDDSFQAKFVPFRLQAVI